AAYGVMKITANDNQLHFYFHKMKFPMSHFHYDRFDTPDDERDGKWSVNFRTNPQGDVDQAVMSLDEAEAVFTRKPDTLDPKLLTDLSGSYETPTGLKIQVVHKENSGLQLLLPGQPPYDLIPTKALRFKIPQFSDMVFEFAMQGGHVTALKQRDPGGEMTFPRK